MNPFSSTATRNFKRLLLLATASLALVAASSGQAQTLLLQLQAANYNPATGVWTATVGPNATVTQGSNPTNGTTTANGSATVDFNGAQGFTLASTIPVPTGAGYTEFAYVLPAAGQTGVNVITTGGSGSFEYRIYQDKQDTVRTQQADLGEGNSTLSNTDFSTIDTTVSTSGGSYRLNGADDGSNSGSSFSSGISYVGYNGNDENYNGSIAEIDIYDGILTSSQIAAQEATLDSEYAAAIPEPSNWAALLVCLAGLTFFRRRSLSRILG